MAGMTSSQAPAVAMSSHRGTRPGLLSAVVAVLQSRTLLAMMAGGALTSLVRWLIDKWIEYRRLRQAQLWKSHIDLAVVQGCLLTTEHLATLGRIEKRTLFVKPLKEVFCNDYIRTRVLEAAESCVKAAQAGQSHDPVLPCHLAPEDKWHVLNTCTNHISSCFAPYHVFFNEARRVESYYKSAWYCFTLTCAQTDAGGRWFITPHHPVKFDDIGMMRIRIVMMNEEEMREIASGAIQAPSSGLFNGRHESRWKICRRFAELFSRQVEHVTGTSGSDANWGPNLCGRLSRKKGVIGSSHALLSGLDKQERQEKQEAQEKPAPHPEENSILRIHIPFPSSRRRADVAEDQGPHHDFENVSDWHSEGEDGVKPHVYDSDCVSRDVVLFE